MYLKGLSQEGDANESPSTISVHSEITINVAVATLGSIPETVCFAYLETFFKW